jgi:hypothetical protein
MENTPQKKSTKYWNHAKRFVLKPIAYASLIAATAISGATLSTQLKRQYHTHDYAAYGAPGPRVSEQEKGKLQSKIQSLGLEPLSDAIMKEVELPRIFLYGAAAPMEVRLELSKDRDNLRMTYWGVWGNNHVVKRQDWEPITLTYSISNGLSLESITVRPHNELGVYSAIDCAKLSLGSIPVVITNPAHTPGVPGCTYSIRNWGLTQAFTQFASEDWAGFSVWKGFPQKMAPMAISITVGAPPEESAAKKTPFY